MRVMADLRPLRVKPYRRLWASRTITVVGSQLTVVAVPLQIYDLTGSSGWIGVAGLVGLVPLVVFALWGGALADVVDRRRMLLVTNAGIAATSFLLWLQALLDLGSIPLLLVLVALQQACFGANAPAEDATIPRIVPASLLPAANALSSTVFWLGSVTGPLLAGVLLPLTGLDLLYLADAVALLVALWAVWRLPALPPAEDAPRRAGAREVIDGFRYLAGRRILLVALLADLIAMLFGMPRALFPQIAQETFGDPPGGGFATGVLFAAFPVGAVCAGLLSGAFTRIRAHGVMVVVSVGVWGAAVAGFGVSRSLWAAVAFLVLGGAALFVLAVFRGTILQAAASDEVRGRIQGALTVVAAGGPRLADLAHGTAGAVYGTAWAVGGGGALTVVAVVAAALAFPSFWRYRHTGEPAVAAEASADRAARAPEAAS